MIRIFLERLIEWDWPDAPGRNPILHGDIPPRTDPLPKFLNDQDATKLMAAARAHRLPRYRLVVIMLIWTGMRASELCELAADSVNMLGNEYWLRIPVGKLRNDRMIPLHARVCRAVGRVDGHQLRVHPVQRTPDGRRARAARPAHRAPHRGHHGQEGRHRALSIPTSSATPSPPRPSTGACASKRLRLCSGIAPWR